MDLTGLKAQWHPTAAWNDEVANVDWVDIDLEMTHMWCRRGYVRGEQKVKAGEFSVTFKDPTRSHDPTKAGSATIGKGRRQFRLIFDVGGTPYPVFRGLTNGNGWKPTWDGGNRFHVTVTGTDRSSAVEAIFMESVFRIMVESLDPVWWFTMEEQGGSTLYNRGTDPTTALVVNANLNGEPVLPFDPSPSGSFGADPGGSGFLGSGSHLQPPFSITAVFATDAPGALYSQNNGTDNVSDLIFAVDWGAALGTLTLFVDDPTNPSIQVNTPQTVSDKAPHIGTASYDDADGVARVKLDLNATEVGPLVAPPVPVPRFGASMIGNTRDGAQPFLGREGHLIAWDRKLSSTEESDLHDAALTSWAGLMSDEVIANILDYCGIPAAERSLEFGQETMGPSRLNCSALTALQRVANTETGLFFFDRRGWATFYDRDYVGADGTTRNTKPTGGDIGLQELDLDTDDTTYYTAGVGYVSTPNPIPVTYRHANAATDGDIVWEPDGGTEYEDRDAAEAGAQRAVGAGAPVPHFTNARSIGTDANIAELLSRDIWDTLDIVAHPAGDTETQPSRILQVEHEMDGTKWTTTLQVEAV